MIAASYTAAGFEDFIGLIVFAVFALIVNVIKKAGASKPASQQPADTLRPQSSVRDELTKFLESIAQAQEQAAAPPPVPAQAQGEYRATAVRAQKAVHAARPMRAQRKHVDDPPHEPISAPINIERGPAPEISAPVQLTILDSLGAAFNADEFRTGDSLRRAVMGIEILGKPIALRGPRQ